MQDIVLPTGITRLPPNLGESKHGKLKAAQWHSLFAYVIPLIVLELFVLDVNKIVEDSNQGQILLNIADLCTGLTSIHNSKSLLASIEICIGISPQAKQLYQVQVGRVQSQTIFVSPNTVTAVAAYRLLDDHTHAIPKDGVILRPCDHTSELDIL
ncbi:uncharacterized protein MELLADRAFT_114077 [Melampsora larici-populina 98AG31]|uniref:Uncharacterized protein n=1 Tax=Melampsora larici-populina (strain 98AG31 / pathotype 3-4-7) TaxID=747676 RepID=F4SC37_MELLP|nr:uncharacterized protein MELLADRAFT_114077 [Melampsora larici-populina 98AG31]EGF97794.1 hypothetical protein MELLADRAFT_114077 [Melampsora larici-populina 98AG31]